MGGFVNDLHSETDACESLLVRSTGGRELAVGLSPAARNWCPCTQLAKCFGHLELVTSVLSPRLDCLSLGSKSNGRSIFQMLCLVEVNFNLAVESETMGYDYISRRRNMEKTLYGTEYR